MHWCYWGLQWSVKTWTNPSLVITNVCHLCEHFNGSQIKDDHFVIKRPGAWDRGMDCAVSCFGEAPAWHWPWSGHEIWQKKCRPVTRGGGIPGQLIAALSALHMDTSESDDWHLILGLPPRGSVLEAGFVAEKCLHDQRSTKTQSQDSCPVRRCPERLPLKEGGCEEPASGLPRPLAGSYDILTLIMQSLCHLLVL